MKVYLHVKYAYRTNAFLYFRPHPTMHLYVCFYGFFIIWESEYLTISFHFRLIFVKVGHWNDGGEWSIE